MAVSELTTVGQPRATESATRNPLGLRRSITYWVVGIGLTLSFFLIRGTNWLSSPYLHTLMENTATLITLIVGTLALVRYYSKKSNIFLFLGAGFLGTAFLDGYHAIVTSAAFAPFLPSDLPTLIPWS